MLKVQGLMVVHVIYKFSPTVGFNFQNMVCLNFIKWSFTLLKVNNYSKYLSRNNREYLL